MGRFAPLAPGTEEKFPETEGGVSGITFDAGGLIALDRNDRRVLALVARATERGFGITIPATALAQRAGQSIVTSDPADFKRIAPELQLVAV